MQRSAPAASHVIPVTQAFLILLDKYKGDKEAFSELKKLYLSGGKRRHDRESINKWMQDPALENYSISYAARDISEDPSRRYFETHLAFWTLAQSIEKLSIDDLNLLFKLQTKAVLEEKRALVRKVLFSKTADFGNEYLLTEYNSALKKLKLENYFPGFNEDEENREKMRLLLKISYLSTVNASSHGSSLPLNIYNTGYFIPEKRGREEKLNQDHVKSNHFGLMKSYMPLPVSDIAYSQTKSDCPRPADSYNFVEKSEWALANFRYLVHPFSCSISGTLLVQLKMFAFYSRYAEEIREIEHALFHDADFIFSSRRKFINYLQAFISLMLFNSGGHSLHEFVAVLAIPEVRKEFGFIRGFKRIDEQELFLTGNEEAFDRAIYSAIAYNKELLKRSAVLQDICNKRSPLHLEDKDKEALAYGRESMFFEADKEKKKEKKQSKEPKPDSRRGKLNG